MKDKPLGEGKQRGMQDRALEVSPSQIDEIIDFRHDHMHMEGGKLVEDIPVLERTDIAQQGFRGTLFKSPTPSRLQQEWDTFTREELIRVRQEIKDISQPQHHKPTPLPFPRQ